LTTHDGMQNDRLLLPLLSYFHPALASAG
jgi:hypothetical protein